MPLPCRQCDEPARFPTSARLTQPWHTFFNGLLGGALAGGVFAAKAWEHIVHFIAVSGVFAVAMLVTSSHLLRFRAPAEEDLHEPETRRRARLPTRIILLGSMAFCIMLSEGAMADWSAVFLNQCLGSDEGLAAMGYAAFAIAMAGGRLIGDAMTVRWGVIRQVRVSGALAAIGTGLVAAAGNIATALVGFACIGGGLSTIIPAVFSAAGRQEDVPPGIGLSTVSTTGYLGFLLGPPCIGMAAELFGLRQALACLVATTLIAVLPAPALRLSKENSSGENVSG